ncbi:DUF2267 domain-containing protein [Nocardia sp. NPDC051981]|uniref:DUF2267 domain-containing protein n=1 Tax=Nocardia sp. NPDC051981 TaxID=3155417 RepID=UPI003437FD90
MLDAVARAAELDTSDQARDALTAVLATCAHCLPPPVRHRHAHRLPGLFEPAIDAYGEPRPLDSTTVIAEVAWRLEVAPERAHQLIAAVLHTLQIQDPDLLADLTAHLRADVIDLLTTPPHHVTSVAPATPAESAREIE